nr:hypothetical protein [Rhodococcus sp. (in: high G+C Gram-positive bacteria)]
MAERLRYEAEVNGTPVRSTSYLSIGTQSSMRTALDATARWCLTSESTARASMNDRIDTLY